MAQINQINPVVGGITELSERLRVLEERYIVLRRKGQLSDENLINSEKDIQRTIEKLNRDVADLHRKLAELDEKLDRFLEQVKNTAPRKDVLALRKYVEMWEPLNFLTRDEALRLLERHKRG